MFNVTAGSVGTPVDIQESKHVSFAEVVRTSMTKSKPIPNNVPKQEPTKEDRVTLCA